MQNQTGAFSGKPSCRHVTALLSGSRRVLVKGHGLMRCAAWIAGLSAILLFVQAGTAIAGPVTFNFAASETFIYDSLDTLPPDVVSGVPLHLSFTFDPTAADVVPNPTLGNYPEFNGVITNATVTVGDATFTHDTSSTFGQFVVTDTVIEAFYVTFMLNDVYGYRSIRLDLALVGSTHGVLTSDSLPQIQPDPTMFYLTTITLLGFGQSMWSPALGVIATSIQSARPLQVIPEPASLAIFGFGLFALAILSRRRRRT
jgi:hypothetical protein